MPSVTFKGKPIQLQGRGVKEGDKAPDCTLTGVDLQPVELSSLLKGHVTVLLSVPSLDTPVCSQEARRFHQEIHLWKGSVQMICVSMDLPFALSRFCTDLQKNPHALFLSDYKSRAFGEKYGLYMPELGLLARAVFVLDATMHIVKAELVPEVTKEPNYPSILAAVKECLPAEKRG